MVPTDTSIQLQTILFLIIHVHTSHLRCRQTLTTSTPASTAGREAHIIDVVGTSHQENLQIVLHPAKHGTSAVAFLCTCSDIGIEHHTLIHARFNTKVEHGFLFTVINTTDTSQITFLIVSLNAFDDVGRQVLHGCLCIACHKLLTINHDFFHFLTVDGNFSVIRNLCARQSLHQLFHDRAFRSTESCCIIYKGICLQRNL